MFNLLKSKTIFTLFLFAVFIAAGSNLLLADDRGSHKQGLHFAHPLITESPSPDTKIRLDYIFKDIEGEGHGDEEEDGEGGGLNEHSLQLEAEYAFSRNFSIEVGVPYTFVDPDDGETEDHFNNIEVGLKFATYIFEEYGLLLGGGLEFGIPSGDDERGIGSDHIIEIEPFLSMGYKYHDFELVSFLSLGFPVNQDDGKDESDEFGYNVSLLYHLTPSIEALLEFDGEVALNGEEDGESVLNISPGIKVKPFTNKNIQIGFSGDLPPYNSTRLQVRILGNKPYE
ncbi:MAG TPA: hypothetical protein VLB82_05170 [Thermodesulfobacteriota bacterium]|nr:hypothetical protein [Thermodesulfobacteriota bacterium]